MNPDFSQLHQLLRARLDIIADHAFRDRDPAGHLAEIQRRAEALAAEHERLKPVLPARLGHFLSQSSLVKALDYLEGRPQEGH